jgi:hypothetical protein
MCKRAFCIILIFVVEPIATSISQVFFLFPKAAEHVHIDVGITSAIGLDYRQDNNWVSVVSIVSSMLRHRV